MVQLKVANLEKVNESGYKFQFLNGTIKSRGFDIRRKESRRVSIPKWYN